jgi:orotate phosphoribosyltransferase-like protein
MLSLFSQGKHCVLVDDLIQSGGTLIETGKVPPSSPPCARVYKHVKTLQAAAHRSLLTQT